MKPWHTPDDHRHLADGLADVHGGGQHVGRGLRAAHHFQQLHHVGRAEEVHADHVLRPAGGRGDFVDVEVAGVAGQDGAGLGDLVELAEQFLLDRHVLEHGLDDQVAVGQRRQVQRGRQRGHALFHVVLRHAALGGGVLVVLADRRGAAVERGLLRFDHGHRDALVEEVHRDAAAHGAGADHAHLLHRPRGRAFGQAVDLGGLALGEEHVALRLALHAADQLHELFALELLAFVEGQAGRRLDALDAGLGRLEAAEGLGVLGAELGKQLGRGAGHRQVAHLLQRALLGQHLAREGDGRGAQFAFGRQFIDQPHRQRRLAAHRRTAGHHLQRLGRADDARQPLRAAGTGQQTELHFRQADSRRRHGHAVVAHQRGLEAAAERGAVDRRHQRFARGFHLVEQRMQRRALRRLAELADVGTGNEGAAFADQHDGLGRVVGQHLVEGSGQSVAHLRRQRIHRR